MEINTLYQLMAEASERRLRQCRPAPDGARPPRIFPHRGEPLRAHQRFYDPAGRRAYRRGRRLDGPALGLRPELFAPSIDPGEMLGPALADVASSVELRSPLSVVAVASHDTASAVLAVPATVEDFAYVVSGTWSLVGFELDRPVIDEASRHANFSNEVGVDGTIRFLRNVMGFWMLQECERTWAASGVTARPWETACRSGQLPGFPLSRRYRRPRLRPAGEHALAGTCRVRKDRRACPRQRRRRGALRHRQHGACHRRDLGDCRALCSAARFCGARRRWRFG